MIRRVVFSLIIGFVQICFIPRSVSNTEITPSKATDYLVEKYSDKYEIDKELVEAIIFVESGGRHDAVSPRGAIGIMQIMPITAKHLNIDPHCIRQNLDGGVR